MTTVLGIDERNEGSNQGVQPPSASSFDGRYI